MNFLGTFRYNQNLKAWLWFAFNTLVSAFVGALMAFLFGTHYRAALAAFGILMAFLTILTVVFTILENQVSILSILNQGLKDGKYEDVIKFGSAMRATLFTSNKNDAIVKLGLKIDEAASKIESAHYNTSTGDYLVTIDGSPKSITQIRAALRIDDLGWSMHLCNRNDAAVDNILQGIKKARAEALRLSRIPGGAKSVAPFVQLIFRGYRHLSGIYYEDTRQHSRAVYYENVTKLIMSNQRVISSGARCSGQTSTPNGTTCGLLCALTGKDKVQCSRKNILGIYFKSTTDPHLMVEPPEKHPSWNDDFLPGGLMSKDEIEVDIALFALLPSPSQEGIIKEQAYAWGRNIVKRLQSTSDIQKDGHFLSDAELSCLLSEARAFAQIYYYGTIDVPAHDDLAAIIKKPVVGKEELRYAGLLNEITLAENLLISQHDDTVDAHSRKHTNIEALIESLKVTRELCRDKRADLYVRASIHLISARYAEYNLGGGTSTVDPIATSSSYRRKRLLAFRKELKSIYDDVIEYQHKRDDELVARFSSILQELRNEEKRLSKRVQLVTSRQHVNSDIIAPLLKLTNTSFKDLTDRDRIEEAVHTFSSVDIERIKGKWSIS